MGKIFVLLGKSATGKDSLFSRLRDDPMLHLSTVVTYTTRPIRSGEQDGKEYFFVTEETLQAMRGENRVIEERTYRTVAGDWSYFTAEDGQIKPNGEDYLLISTLEGYQKLLSFFGKNRVVPLYIEVADRLRLCRAIERESRQTRENYEELCRRFLADAGDFSEEKLLSAGIKRRFQNENLEVCKEELAAEIQKQRSE